MGGLPDVNEPIEQWTTLFATCFRKRIRAHQVSLAISKLWTEQPVSGPRLITTILRSNHHSTDGVDPLIPAYIEVVLQSTTIDVCDVLLASLAHSPYSIGNLAKRTLRDEAASLQEGVLTLLARYTDSISSPRSTYEARRTLRALGEWIIACNKYETTLQVESTGLRELDASTVATYEALGGVIIATLTNSQTREDLHFWPRGSKDKLALAVGDFAALLSQWSVTQTAPRLQLLSRTPPLISGKPDFTTAEIASAVTELLLSNSRVGLYAYLNAALCARPLTEDLTLLNYLHAKYPNDTQSLIVDLIIAAFDVLANALNRHLPAQKMLCYRSFVANKLPILLLSLAGSLFQPLSAQLCIRNALERIDVHPFPSLSSESERINETLKNSRSELIQACLLHQLGTDLAFSNIHGDVSTSMTFRASRYQKETLIAQCTTSVHKAEELVAELENMHGNAGAISQALVETIQHYCNSKETMSLRTLCNAISRRLGVMDVVLQYTQPTNILIPLCNMLDKWTHDEDQSEYQPPYEEFASILLLVMAIIHRYDLSITDIGLTGGNHFVARLSLHLSDSIPINELSDEQSKQLAKWIGGLYATDEHGETNGISDEIMSHCPPQAFYILVPTLLEQSIHACRRNVLALNTLKGGLEFLLEPFLLPSLIGGLNWITKHSWEDHGDADVVVQVLHKLLLPSSISGDAQAMHQTILAMIASPLERSLRELQRRNPTQKDVDPLIEALKPYLSSQRAGSSSASELQDWTSATAGGLRGSLRAAIRGMTMWVNQTSMSPVPPPYTHRMVLAALELLGADEVLEVLVLEVRNQTSLGFGSVALEVAAALICAPTSAQIPAMMQFDGASHQSAIKRRTLGQALRHKLESPKDLLQRETEYVEALVRLGRGVDAQSAISTVSHLNMPAASINTQDIMQDISMTAVDTIGDSIGLDQPSDLPDTSVADFGAVMDETMGLNTGDASGLGSMNDVSVNFGGNLFGQGQDMTFGLGDTSQQHGPDMSNPFGMQTTGDGTQNAEEDIFAGLDMGDIDDDFNFS